MGIKSRFLCLIVLLLGSILKVEAQEILKFKRELYTIISKHSHQTFEKVWNDSDRNYWMNAEEAKAYGMIDEILIRKPKKRS